MGQDSILGQHLDEYRLEKLLGRGNMARVYRGLDMRLNRWVAIKVIDTPFRSDSEYVKRFEREAQAIAQLQHPHIVTVYRYGQVRNVLYIAMQYIEGSDLETVLDAYRSDGRFMSPPDVSRIIREVCLALDHAHAQGVIHRDVKPSNIMLDKLGRGVLTDFGLALMTELGTYGEILGTPHYIAPEQAISSAKVSPQSDLYAVGVTLFEMFTGYLPFDSEVLMDIALMHVNQPAPAPRQFRPDISPAVEAVILQAMAKDPRDRYPTGAALADALDRALGLDQINYMVATQDRSMQIMEVRLAKLTAQVEALTRQLEILNRQFLPLQQNLLEVRRAVLPERPESHRSRQE
jgi:serine/threonine protein kinase